MYILNRFLNLDKLIIHKGTPCIINSIASFNVGDILEFKYTKTKGPESHLLRFKTGRIADFNRIKLYQPFIILQLLRSESGCLLEIKYLTELEFFDKKYNINE